LSGSGTVLVERYRLEERLSGPDPLRGSLWRAVDVIAADLPVAIRQLKTPAARQRLEGVWPQLQTLSHPHWPRHGELLELDGALWLVRDWQDGTTYDLLLRQGRCGADEVLLLLRQVLPVLALLHERGLVHGDLNPHHLLRRSSDGLLVVLEGGRMQRQGATPTDGSWRDLHDLGVTALVLLGGTAGEGGGWPKGLELEAGFRQVLERLLSEAPEHRFDDAAEVLQALESVVLPASERESGVTERTSRALAREQGAEGRLWPMVIALGLLALVGSAIGWFLLPRSSPPDTALDRGGQPLAANLPPAELDQRQQWLSRLRALQVDRGWFVELVDASKLSTESEQDGPLRRGWNELAEQWLARIALLPPEIRARLGRLGAGDWQQLRQALLKQGVHPRVVEQLVSAGVQDLLPVTMRGRKPAAPFLQLWIAAAMQSLHNVEIVRLKARLLKPTNTPLRIPAGGARLVLVEAPAGDAVALGIDGTPLMQMMVFGINGQVVEKRGPLRMARIAPDAGSPLQVLVTNQGVSSSRFTLSCRAEPLDQ
jgi:serine/threonine-protein kinase